MTLREHLVRVSDVYAAAVGLSRSRISTIVLNRGATLDAIANGGADVTTQTFEKAMLWFSQHWPEGTAWPADIQRPLTAALFDATFGNDPLPPHDADRVATAGPEHRASGPALSREAAE